MQPNKPYIWLRKPGQYNILEITLQCPTGKGLNTTPATGSDPAAGIIMLTYSLDTTSTPLGAIVETTIDLDNVVSNPTSFDKVIVKIMDGSTEVGSATAKTSSGGAYFN